MKIPIILSVIFFFVIFLSCEMTEEPVDYTYSISNLWWSDSIDGNQDGYLQYKKLNLTVTLQEKVTRSIQAQIYYKLVEASDFSFYAFSSSAVINGGTDKDISISIGKPNKELSKGIYDFAIKIYETGSERLEAKSGEKDSLVLLNNKFEASGDDNNFDINIWWSNKYDRNKNGYSRSADLNFDINTDQSNTKTVDVNIYRKESAAADYTQINSLTNISIDGSIPDTLTIPIQSETNDTLYHGTYDFRVEVYEMPENILVALADESLPELKGVGFESEDEDSYHYYLKGIHWADSIDADNDGYTQFRNIFFDVDIAENVQRTLFAKIFLRHPDSTDYEILDSTSTFNITGSNANDNISMSVGKPGTKIDSSQYDILISIYENEMIDSLNDVVATSSAWSDTMNLSKQKFETADQDSTGL